MSFNKFIAVDLIIINDIKHKKIILLHMVSTLIPNTQAVCHRVKDFFVWLCHDKFNLTLKFLTMFCHIWVSTQSIKLYDSTIYRLTRNFLHIVCFSIYLVWYYECWERKYCLLHYSYMYRDNTKCTHIQIQCLWLMCMFILYIYILSSCKKLSYYRR